MRKSRVPEPKFKWQDALGLVGALLAIGGMADLPSLLRLACFISCAICLPISFSSHLNWPQGTRWFLSLSVIALMGFVSFWEVVRPADPKGEASISISRRVGFFNTDPAMGKRTFGINVFYRNSGNAKATFVGHRSVLRLSAVPLDANEIRDAQNLAHDFAWYKAVPNDSELPPNSSDYFFTIVPGETDEIAVEKAQEVIASKTRLYIFDDFLYGDEYLPSGKARLTEECHWVEGNFEAWHLCGVNRTRIVEFRLPQ